MQKVFEIPIVLPSSWQPPYVEENEEQSDFPLEFILFRDFEGLNWHYKCRGRISAGGEIGDIFKTVSLPESEWPVGEGVPKLLVHEMYSHGRQHEIIWRWAVNRIPSPKYDV